MLVMARGVVSVMLGALETLSQSNKDGAPLLVAKKARVGYLGLLHVDPPVSLMVMV